MNYPLYEVWGGYSDEQPKHLKDCFTESEAKKAAEEYKANQDMFAFIRRKDDDIL